MKQNIFLLLELVFHWIPLRKDIVLFQSFNDLYNDNPKYISIELHKRDKSVKQIWVVSKRTNKLEIPSYVKLVKLGSLLHFYYKNRSKILIDNYVGVYYSIFTDKLCSLISIGKIKPNSLQSRI